MIPLLVLAFVDPALACGPFIPQSLLSGEQSACLSGPVAGFDWEIAQIPIAGPTFPAGTQEVWDLEAVEFAGWLGDGFSATHWVEVRSAQVPNEWDPKPIVRAPIPPGLPGVALLYQEAAQEWRAGARSRAVGLFETLAKSLEDGAISGPVAETYRLRILYMGGQAAHLRGDAAAARRRYQALRAAAQAGAADPLGLAAASLGEEALVANNVHEAIDLYLLQSKSDGGAVDSLREVARGLVDRCAPDPVVPGLTADSECVHDPETRAVVTAWLLSDLPDSSGHKGALEAWAVLLRDAPPNVVTGLDRVAWVSWNAGNFNLAAELVARAPETPIRHWVAGRLAQRDGDLAKADALLAQAAAGLPPSGTWGVGWTDRDAFSGLNPADQAWQEAARLRLDQDRYPEALSAALLGRDWLGAAYIAEQVMKIDELVAYVDQVLPTLSRDGKPPESAEALRHLLARRLVRAQRPADAARYLPESWKESLKVREEGLAVGRDPKRSPQDRARGLWAAAYMTRYEGMELMGTEFAPDDFVWGGNEWGWGGRGQPTQAEVARVAENQLPNAKRFHYRYEAAALAAEAADLLPNDTEETAALYCQAGSWLQNRDPQAADPYYKKLVNRNWNIALAAEADVLRWFPSCPLPYPGVDIPVAGASSGWCSTTPAAAGGPWWVGLLLLAGVRRRR